MLSGRKSRSKSESSSQQSPPAVLPMGHKMKPPSRIAKQHWQQHDRLTSVFAHSKQAKMAELARQRPIQKQNLGKAKVATSSCSTEANLGAPQYEYVEKLVVVRKERQFILVMEMGKGHSLSDWRKKKRPLLRKEISQRMIDKKPTIQYLIDD